jgi:hypothetical protein
MEIALSPRPAHRPQTMSADRHQAFCRLEMMMVVRLILIVASIAAPIYRTCPSADGCGRSRQFPSLVKEAARG